MTVQNRQWSLQEFKFNFSNSKHVSTSSTVLAKDLGHNEETEATTEQRRAAHREAQIRYREARAEGENKRASETGESTTHRLAKERSRRHML